MRHIIRQKLPKLISFNPLIKSTFKFSTRILLADKMPNSLLKHLKSHSSIDLLFDPELIKQNLSNAINKFDPQILVVRST